MAALDRQPQRGRLQNRAGLADLRELRPVDGEDERALLRLGPHQTLQTEAGEGFAHRRPADAVAGGDLRFRERLTEIELAVDDLPAQAGRHHFRQRFRPFRRYGFHASITGQFPSLNR